MKKTLINYLLLSVCVFFTSCEDFLVRAPYDNLAYENFYNTERDIELAVLGCYNSLIEIKNTREVIFNENRSDNSTYRLVDAVATHSDDFYPSLMTVDPANVHVERYWQQAFNLIARTNMVLANIDKVENEQKSNQLRSEAKFLRAWIYFNLVRYFGAVPIISEPVSSGNDVAGKTRDDVETVYAFIVSDLSDSYMSLPDSYDLTAEYGRANKWAAAALLGKVLLTADNFTEAKVVLQDVYDNSPYSLIEDFGDLFCEDLEVSNASREILFPVRFQGGGVGLGSNIPSISIPMIGTSLTGICVFSNSLDDAFHTLSDVSLDKRYPLTCSIDPVNERRFPAKSVGLVKSGTTYTRVDIAIANDSGLDWPVIRFSDVILMLAEVTGYTETGLGLLNEVRARANAPLYTMEDIQNKFAGNFREAILAERRLEFAFEGERFFDLLRMGKDYTAQVLFDFYKTEPAFDTSFPQTNVLVNQLTSSGTIEDWRFLLPLPVNQVRRSTGLEQNPGYSQ